MNKGSNPEVRKDLIDERVWRKVIAFGQRQAATEEKETATRKVLVFKARYKEVSDGLKIYLILNLR